MNLTLGLCILSVTAAAVFYVADWLDEGSAKRLHQIRGLPSLRTGASLFVSLAFYCLHQYRTINDTLPELAAHIPPYPEAVVVDRTAAAGISIWTLETQDPPEAVVSFYEHLAGEKEWKLDRSYRTNPWVLGLQPGGSRVSVMVYRKPRATEIGYTVHRFGDSARSPP